MEKDHLSRKLAVLLHADVDGSTLLVQKNETLAHERIRDTFRRFSQIINSHGGIAHEIRGDALVAEFARASDAVSASIAFQTVNATHNEQLSDDIRPVLRIGIAIGEVVVADNTVTGEGIVLAQRLEQLAEPGSICIQGAAYETVPKRLPFEYENIGEHSLKGFDEPVRVLKVKLKTNSEITETETPPQPAFETPDLPEKPSIAVLPFTNMSGDPEQVYFADGIAEDVITALSRFHDLLVIARNSSFTYRGASVDVRQVGRELDVLYVLEGSVRIAGNRVRITAQLVATSTGNHIWAEHFDRSLEDVFEVQDEITALVASTVGQQVVVAESKSALKRDDQDLRARDLIARAKWHTDHMTEESFAKARELSVTAIERYPQYVGAHSLFAFINIIEMIYGWGDRSYQDLATGAAEAARTAIKIDPDDEAAHTFRAMVHWWSGEHDAAIDECETVIRFNPNFASAVGVLGMVYAYSGANSYEHAVECLDRAIRLSPNDPWLQLYLVHRGTAEFFSGHYETAVEWFQKSIQRNPDFPTAHRLLASACALKGDLEKARAALDEVKRLVPDFSISGYSQRLKQVFKLEEDFERVVEGLRLAGAPE
jgi:TolB-like protein